MTNHLMKSDKPFILRIPPILLTRSFYLWVFIIAFMYSYPYVSLALAAFLMLNLVLLKIQRITWQNMIRQDRLYTGSLQYTDGSRPTIRYLLINWTIILVIGLLAGYFLDGLLYWSGLQWFLMTAVFWWLMQWLELFWLPPSYMLTTRGIWVLLDIGADFIAYKKLRKIKIIPDFTAPIGPAYMILRVKYRAGLLLASIGEDRLTWYTHRMILTPDSWESFVEKLPANLVSGNINLPG